MAECYLTVGKPTSSGHSSSVLIDAIAKKASTLANIGILDETSPVVIKSYNHKLLNQV